MLSIVIPMAGKGSRFQERGYRDPKPLIPIHGKPMIQLVVDSVRPARDARFVFLVLREHLERYGLEKRLTGWAPGAVVIPLDGTTEGAACTVLLAEPSLDPREPMMIVNSDQWIDASIDRFLDAADAQGTDGLIMTMEANTREWSYAKTDGRGRVVRVAEKEVISNEATVGIYHFRRASDFLVGARAMIAADDRVNGEFYVAPVYNHLIRADRKIGTFSIGSVGRGMHSMGTPELLEAFLNLPIARRAAGLELEARNAANEDRRP
jgi:NDP-sugar pyrophosphorylase family protein